MIGFHRWAIVFFLRVYVASALAVAAILSPLGLSLIPILLLVWYLYLWRWRLTPVADLLTEFFMFFAVALLFSLYVGPLLSMVISMPILLLINLRLEEAAELLTYRETKYVHRPTDIGLALLLITVLVFGIALLFGNLSLLLVSVVAIVYFTIIGVIALRRLLLKPAEETQVQQRMVAGSEAELNIKLTVITKIGGLLFVESPYEWLKVSPGKMSLKNSELVIRISLSPRLSGPSIIKLKGQATDRWGLIRVSFEMEPIRLYVIPRARYAAWLAKKYLAGSKPGILPLISNIAALKPTYGLRRGVEYYGNRQYQPGDSLKNIDWKHSLKYNELVSKEFTEFHGRSAIILVNLAIGNAEEADKLAYNIIVTAISLAQENIPAALAAYDHEGVKLTTTLLSAQQLLLQSIKIAGEMAAFVDPVRYLNPPDVSRLRANIGRIQFAESQASKVLAQLLQLEYKNLQGNARLNPATRALSETLGKVDRQSNIVIISQYNHDAEALAFNVFELARKGSAVITV